ncbi:phage integrase SAM-like domain-containing protein [bacterium]
MEKKKATAKSITLEIAVSEFLKYLKEDGKNESTVAVYGRCLENVSNYFGTDKALGKLTPATIGQFYKSDVFLKKPNGVKKSPITLTQNKRVLKMMLTWAVEKSYIADIPLPKAELKGGKKKNGKGTGNNEPADAE